MLSILKRALVNIRIILNSRTIIYEMLKREVKSEYVDSYLGIFWVYGKPLGQILVMWFAFSYGFKITNLVGGVSYTSFLVVGIVSWNLFSDSINNSSTVFSSFSFLVKKTNFNFFILPIVKFASILVIHTGVLVLTALILFFQGVYPSIYNLQIFYYIGFAFFLFFGLSLFLSSVSLFIRDITKIITLAVSMGIWLTPVMWDPGTLGPQIAFVVKLNPAAYIVEGYRYSFYLHKPFWSDPNIMIYNWTLALIINYLGIYTYSKLKPHFAEVV